MRAEVGEADKRLPPVKGWEFLTTSYTSNEFHTTSGWSSGDQTLECSRHPSAESAGQFVRQKIETNCADIKSYHGKSVVKL